MIFYIERLYAYIKILRPLNVVFGVLSVLITADLLDIEVNLIFLLYPSLIVALFIAAANVTNDIFDFPTDKINRPRRPIPSGNIRLPYAVFYAFTLYTVGIILTFYINSFSRMIALVIVLPLLVLYTPVFKKIPLMGNMIIGLVLGSVFIFSEVAFTDSLGKMWIPFLLAFGLTFIRELVKDMEDVEGDTAAGISTYPMKFGLVKSFYILIALSTFLCAGALIPYFLSIYGYRYFLVLITGVEIPLLASIFYLSRGVTPKRCGNIASVIKLITLMGMLTIWTIGKTS